MEEGSPTDGGSPTAPRTAPDVHLDQHVKREGRRQHNTILYRRLALLQNEAPSAAVIRSVPAGDEDIKNNSRAIDRYLAMRMPDNPPGRKRPGKGTLVHNDASTLKKSLGTNRRKQKALNTIAVESLRFSNMNDGGDMLGGAEASGGMLPRPPQDASHGWAGDTAVSTYTQVQHQVPPDVMSPFAMPASQRVDGGWGASPGVRLHAADGGGPGGLNASFRRTPKSPAQQQQGISPIRSADPSARSPRTPHTAGGGARGSPQRTPGGGAASARSPGALAGTAESYRALPMSPLSEPSGEAINRLCAPPLGLSPRNFKSEARQAVFHNNLLRDTRDGGKDKDLLGDVGSHEVGFEELFAAIAKTISAIQRQSHQDVGSSFTLLSAHIKGLMVDEESSRLVAILEPHMTAADASGDAGARMGLLVLDHVFCLLDSVNPRLRGLLRWAREKLCAAVYCASTNLHEDDFGKDADDPDRMFYGECMEWELQGPTVFAGPPPLPPKSLAHTLLDLQDAVKERACLDRLLDSYKARLHVEDNRIQQETATRHHQYLINQKKLADRMISAEAAVANFWRKSMAGRLFYAWRGVTHKRKEDEAHDAEVQRLGDEINVLQRRIYNQDNERVRVEQAYEDQLKKMEMKVTELTRALESKTIEHTEMNEKTKMQAKQILQLQADTVLLKERNKRLVTKLETREQEMEALKLSLQQTTYERDSLRTVEKNHHRLMDTCGKVLQVLQFRPLVTDPAGGEDVYGPGLLRHYMSTFTNNALYPMSRICDNLADGISAVFSGNDDLADTVKRAEGTLAKAKAMFDLLRSLLGDTVPFSVQSLVPPVQSNVLPDLVALLAAKAVQPLPETLTFQAGTDTSDVITQMEAAALNMRRALHISMIITEDAARYPKNTTYFGGYLAPTVKTHLFTPHPSSFVTQRLSLMLKTGKLEAVRRRVLEFAAELEYLMEAYAVVYLVAPGVKEMMEDSKLSREVVQEVLSCMPGTPREEVTPGMFSGALICGACRLLPRMPPEESFEVLLRQHLLRNCKSRRRRDGVAVNDVFTQYERQLQLVYDQIRDHRDGPRDDSTVTVSKVEKFLRRAGLSVADDDISEPDPAEILTTSTFVKIHEVLNRADVGKPPPGDFEAPLHQFRALLVLTAQMKYPSPVLTDYERLRRLLEEHVFPAANS